MNCFGYGHLKPQCKEAKKTLCSECGSGTHSYRECKSHVKKCINCGGAPRTLANSCPIRKETIKTFHEKFREKKEETKPIRVTVQATTNAWKPLINRVRQDIKETTSKAAPAIHLALPNDLSKVILIILLHAHLENLIFPELGFRHHAKAAFARNNLPDLDFGESYSWGILKVVQPPAQAEKAPTAPPKPAEAPVQTPTKPQAPTPALQPTQAPPQVPQPAQDLPIQSHNPEITFKAPQSLRSKNLSIVRQSESRDPQ